MVKALNRSLSSFMGSVRMGVWKLGVVPHNTAVFLATSAVLVQSKAWRIRQERKAA